MFVVGCTAGGVPYGCFEDEPDGDAFDVATGSVRLAWHAAPAGRPIRPGPVDSTLVLHVCYRSPAPTFVKGHGSVPVGGQVVSLCADS